MQRCQQAERVGRGHWGELTQYLGGPDPDSLLGLYRGAATFLAMFRRVLIANRGEIAIRVARGLSELGIEPIAVHSAIDAGALHVRAASQAVDLGGETAAESYLDIQKLLDAAAATGADAVHPGYGFLSENPEFVRAVEAAGLTFIGPSPEHMEALGSKQRARQVAVDAGVPVIPGYDGGGDAAKLRSEAERIGFPLMVKASAGGGGKGMRMVERIEDFDDALLAGQREALAAFGDDGMVLERRVQPARHIEIQMFGDAHGDAISLHERECSVQRRHQKVLEEAPSPAVDNDLRRRMGEAAVKLAKAIGYRNAGTVEFLVDDDSDFYFLEVNTRLQVEHPVTELVTGLDLVHLQVRIALGEKLTDLLGGVDITPRGHALEARVYAENPEAGYLPAAGRLKFVHQPEGPGIRWDSGVESNTEVSVHYDPMLAKLIVNAPTRRAACERMSKALAETAYLGIPTNIDFLRRVVDDEAFRSGAIDIDFLERRPELAAGPDLTEPPDLAYVAAALCNGLTRGAAARAATAPGAANEAQPWNTLTGFRLWEGE